MSLTRSAWLSALGAFESAARHQNFARAALELHLTAGAVGHHVRKLESHLGLRLFQRHARGVSLTAEGRLLADAAGNALGDLDSALAALRPRPRPTGERVRLATLHSFVWSWLLPRLPAFAREHTDVRLSVETEVALTRFDANGPDLGIRHGPGSWPGLVTEPLLSEWLFPVLAPEFPGRDRIAEPADLLAFPLIADLSRQGWLDWFRAAGVRRVRLPEMHTFSDSTDALEAAAQGLGIALARSRVVGPWLSAGRLLRGPGPALRGRFGYFLIHAEDRPLSPGAARFAAWLRVQASAEVQEPGG
jgi:LysR family transcriptional regulator, glycine cleavage system transcriptional activator